MKNQQTATSGVRPFFIHSIITKFAMKPIINKTFALLFAALTILTVHVRADEPTDENKRIDGLMFESHPGKHGILEANLIKNGWAELQSSETKTILNRNLGVINGKYKMFYRLTIEKRGVTDYLYDIVRGNISLNDGNKSGNLAVGYVPIRSRVRGAPVAEVTSLAGKAADYLKTAINTADKCTENSITNYNQVLREDKAEDAEYKSKITFIVSSDGTTWINIDTNYNTPIQITMGDAKAIVALLQAEQSKIDAIMQTSRAEASEVVAGQMSNERASKAREATARQEAAAKQIQNEERDKLDAYFATLAENVKQAHVKPKGVSGEFVTRVEYYVGADGAIGEVKIIRSSGNSAYDESVLKAFRSTRPIGPRPDGIGGNKTADFRINDDDGSRPRAAKNVRPTVLADNKVSTPNVGISGFDAKWSNYGAYLQKLIDAVQIQWDNLNDKSKTYPPRGTKVTIKFRLDSDGKIAEIVDAVSNGGTQATQICVSAITDKAPYGKWTKDMIATLGDSQEMTFTFYYR